VKPGGIGSFNWFPWQADALGCVLASDGRPVAWAGGKGSGKSVVACAGAVLVASTRPGAEVALVMDTYKNLRDIHLPILSRMAASAGFTHRPSDAEFIGPNGSVIRMRHLDTVGDPRLGGSPIEGMNLHAVFADECQQIDPRYWGTFHERARVTVTDVQGVPCLPRVVTSGLPVSTWWCAETARAGGRVFRPRTRDNTALDASYEANLRATYTERMARAMLDGEEYAPEGQIVEEYRAALEPHGTLTDWTPDPSACRFVLAMDLGLNNPHALLAAEDAERGRWVVIREWYSTGRPITIAEFCRRIGRDCVPRRVWKPGALPIDEVVTDPAGAAHSAHTGHSDLDLIALAPPDGLGLRPLVETIPERRSVVGSLNRMRLAIERGRLLIHRSVYEAGLRDDSGRSLHASLVGYRWDPRGREEPMKDGITDHAVDALRYLSRRVLWHVVEAPALPGAASRPAPVASGVRSSGRVAR
jgi:hypothetical protein